MSQTALASIPIFSHLSPDALAQVAALMVTRTVAANETIFLINESGDELFVIDEGSVRIWIYDGDSHGVTLSDLGPGEFFGELAVVDGGARSANATALEATTLRCLRRDDVEAFLRENPASALDVIRGLGQRLRQTNQLVTGRVSRNANVVHDHNLSKIDRLAMAITDRVGSFGFFLIIATWTVVWTGYNIIASTFTSLNWQAFDPFPAFVAYLLISNVIQIMLMPLIMVGQNLQSRHAETRAELDFEINKKAEREITATLLHIERQSELLRHVLQKLDRPR